MHENDPLKSSLISEISKSDIFKNTQSIFKEMNTEKIVLLTSLISSMIGIVLKDNKVTEDEVIYLKKQIQRFIKLEDEHFFYLIDLNLEHAKNNPSFLHHLDHYADYINLSLNQDNKINFLNILFVLSRADLDFNKKEERLLLKFSKRFGIENNIFQDFTENTQSIIETELRTNSKVYVLRGTNKYNI